jgi:hypothetical protein
VGVEEIVSSHIMVIITTSTANIDSRLLSLRIGHAEWNCLIPGALILGDE